MSSESADKKSSESQVPESQTPARYNIHLPSVHDGLTLNCRLQFPDDLGDVAHYDFDNERGFRGAIIPYDQKDKDSSSSQSIAQHFLKPPPRRIRSAIIAHPMPQLGGTQDDRIVQSTADTLVKNGYLVMTFNFRGAGDSQGRRSWSGKPEIDDYISVYGFMVNFLDNLSLPEDAKALSSVPSSGKSSFNQDEPFDVPPRRRHRSHIVLSGYSFGALVMARLPAVEKMIERFADASEGSVEAKIVEQAKQLAAHDQRLLDSTTFPYGWRMNSGLLQPPDRQRGQAPGPVTVGVAAAGRGRAGSLDMRRSGERMRQPNKYLPRHSSDRGRARRAPRGPIIVPSGNQRGPAISVAYLLISPVLFPLLGTFMAPPQVLYLIDKNYWTDAGSGMLSSTLPIYMIYGENDTGKRLDRFAEKLRRRNPKVNNYKVPGADHFWSRSRLELLQKQIKAWFQHDFPMSEVQEF